MKKFIAISIIALFLMFFCSMSFASQQERWGEGDMFLQLKHAFSTTAGHDHDGVSSEGDLAPTSLAVAGNTTIAGTILPTTSHTRNIGSSTYEISGIYADGATLDSITVIGGSANGMTVGAVMPSTGAFTTLAYSGVLSPGAASSELANYEIFTTGDTLVATDSGKYLIAFNQSLTSDAIVDFVLPSVAAGLEYKIVAGGTFYVRVDTSSALQGIMYSTCVVGDRILSAGASADSVTLVSDGSRWYVGEMKGTWTDAS